MKAVVVGGGPVGLSAAFGLRRCGFDVCVYDCVAAESALDESELSGLPVEAKFGDASGGLITIHSNGLYALQSLGLHDTVNACPHINIRHFGYHKIDGSDPILLRARKTKRSRPQHKQFLRSNIHIPILKACLSAGVKIVLDKKLVNVVQDSNQVLAYFEDDTFDTADILLGADGVNSAVRSCIFPRSLKPVAFWTGYVGTFTRCREINNEVTELDLDAGVYMDPLNGRYVYCGNGSDDYGGWSVVQRMTKDSNSKARNESEHEDPRTMLKRLAVTVEQWGLPESVVSCIRNADRVNSMTLYDLPDLPTFYSQRVVLLGDAAHGMLPTIGQGLCAGLEDAAVLADLFSEFTPAMYPTVFSLYDTVRLPRVSALCKISRNTAAQISLRQPILAKFGRLLMRTKFVVERFFGSGDKVALYDYREELTKCINEFKSSVK
ncbi:hypothetical protein HDU82_007495 [Entophlyctis luteolus]|nr:hypothetical protein HDU82_007495 [Entophlyctis luteolus]